MHPFQNRGHFKISLGRGKINCDREQQETNTVNKLNLNHFYWNFLSILKTKKKTNIQHIQDLVNVTEI